MPFGDQCQYHDFAACVRAHADKADPHAYCATLMRDTEASCRRRALVSRWRHARKAVQPITTANINAVARKLEPVLARRFRQAVAQMRGSVDLEALAQAMQIQSAVDAIRSLNPETWSTSLNPAARILPTAFQQAGQVEADLLASRLGITTSFNLTNPRAVEWARVNSARLITDISESVREAVRQIITRAFTEGIAPREAARLIREIVGLTDRQAMAVINYRFDLLEAGRSVDDVVRLAARYSQELLNYRALLIARTKTITASARGQQELWRQAVDRGLLDPNKTVREWIVTDDDRLCEEICAPMDGQQVGLEEAFTTGDGESVDGPPAHVQCRCAYGLAFTD